MKILIACCIILLERTWFPALHAIATEEIQLPPATHEVGSGEKGNPLPGKKRRRNNKKKKGPAAQLDAETGGGMVLLKDVNYETALDEIQQLRQLLAQDPSNSLMHAEIAIQLQRVDLLQHSGGQLQQEALYHYTQALALGSLPENLNAIYLNLGLLQSLMGNTSGAVGAFSEAIRHSPTAEQRSMALHHRGDAYSNIGKFSLSAADHRAALAEQPADASAWSSLVQVLKDHPDCEGTMVDWYKMKYDMEVALATLTDSPSGTAKLHFALFTATDNIIRDAYDTEAATRAAWEHLVHANSNLFVESTSDKNYLQEKRRIRDREDQIMKLSCLGLQLKLSGGAIQSVGNMEHVPVFIVGMLRSGSTLVEQIMSTHSQVYGAGEDSAFGAHLGNTVQEIDRGIQTQTMQGFAESVRRAATAVINTMQDQVPEDQKSTVKRIVDKNLSNYKYIGLIKLLFPKAVIIHTKRSFMDVIFSIWRHRFNDSKLAWTYNLREIFDFYVSYAKTMKRWHEVMPGEIMDVVYEDMVSNQAGMTTKVMQKAGLPWEDSLLEFYNHDRSVHTTSSAQVRRPIDKRAIGAWRKYKHHIIPEYESFARECDVNLDELLGSDWRQEAAGFKPKDVLVNTDRPLQDISFVLDY